MKSKVLLSEIQVFLFVNEHGYNIKCVIGLRNITGIGYTVYQLQKFELFWDEKVLIVEE